MIEPEHVLIDTSAWILALRSDGSAQARRTVEQLLQAARAVTTPVIMLELLSGTRSAHEFSELKEEFEALTPLELTPSVWEAAFRLGYDLRRLGLTLPTVDVVIATLAMEYGCILLHGDRHFEQVA